MIVSLVFNEFFARKFALLLSLLYGTDCVHIAIHSGSFDCSSTNDFQRLINGF